MKVIIAPSKTMKYQKNNISTTNILFKEENEYLRNILKKYNDEDIMSLMKISYKQATKVIDYFNSYETYPALYLYSGTVFKQLELSQYKEKEHEYLRKHLNIMSAYYGVLNYNSSITPYRLDMTMKPNNLNLYDYWYTPVYQYFENEDFIISLASKEFTTMIKHPHLYFIDFVEINDTKEVRNSMIIKKLRGKMLNDMILHNITTLDELKHIELDGFIYNEDMSIHNTIVFAKKK